MRSISALASSSGLVFFLDELRMSPLEMSTTAASSLVPPKSTPTARSPAIVAHLLFAVTHAGSMRYTIRQSGTAPGFHRSGSVMPVDDLAKRVSIEFMKMHGSGNDFVVIDNRARALAEGELSEFSELVSRRATSIGADGVVLIEDPVEPETDFGWRYFNADGSDGEMCGNGAMCGARFAELIGAAGSEMAFSTMSGTVRARVDWETGQVELAMPDTGAVEPKRTVEHRRDELRADPHTGWRPALRARMSTTPMPSASRAELERIGRAIRRSDAFAPAGTNVNVVSQLGENRLRMRTYERGVEAETLACGTGAVASAVVSAALGRATSPVEIITSSGMPLVASFDLGENGARTVALRGQTRIVMTGSIRPDALAR